MKYAFFKTKINFAVFYQCVWIGAPDEHDILPTAKLLGFFFFARNIMKYYYKVYNQERRWPQKLKKQGCKL